MKNSKYYAAVWIFVCSVFASNCSHNVIATPNKSRVLELADGLWIGTELWYFEDTLTRKSQLYIAPRGVQGVHKGLTIETIKIIDKETGVIKLKDSPAGRYIPFDREVHKIGSNKDGHEVAANTIKINPFLSKPVDGNTTTVELKILIHYINGSTKRVQMKRVWSEFHLSQKN